VRRLGSAIALALALLFAPAASAALPPIHHVFVIVLENQGVGTTFAPGSPAPYLSQTLRARGAYVPRYYGVGHESNDNYIAMISGQAPNTQTQADCAIFSDFVGGSIGAGGQAAGTGCVYPAGVPTIASQLSAAGLTWRDYNEGMGADPTRETVVCAHPAVGSRDNAQTATATDQYATRHNPFVYFHSIIDDSALCNSHVVGLDYLPQDLATPQPPSYAFITPNLCDDGHDATCAGGGAGGLPRADQFLRSWVPMITGSTAFRRDGGLLLVIFDEAGSSDTTACCGEIPGPGSPLPGITGPGGGDTGAVLLSPYIRGGTTTSQPYNHYTMLRSVEDLFGLGHIGYASLSGGRSFGTDVFACAPAVPPVAVRGRLPSGSEFTAARLVGRGSRRSLTLRSVGAASLTVRVVISRHHSRLLRRTLTPCTTATLRLPRLSHARIRVAAVPLSGGIERANLRY
jgi:hypothetical protein